MSKRTKRGRRDELIEECRGYARFLVVRMVQMMGLPPRYTDEFVAAAYLGLVEAAERFDHRSDIDFKSYAYLRIRGAVIDSIRHHSELTGSAYKYARALQAMQDFREEGVASRVGASAEPAAELARVLDYAASGALAFKLSMNDVQGEVEEVPDSCASPEENLRSKELRAVFSEILHELPTKERAVMKAFYIEGKSMQEIGETGGVASSRARSKSWVSRLHTRGLQMVRQRYLELLETDEL